MRAVALFARGLASANWCTVLTQGHRGYCATVALYCCFQSPVPAAAATGEHWLGRAGPRHQAALLLTSQWVWCWVEVSLVTTGGAVWSAEARLAVCSVYRRLPPVTGDNAAAAVVCGAVRGGAGLGARTAAIGGTIARPDNVGAGADAGTSLHQPAPSSTMHRGHAPRPPLFWPGRTSPASRLPANSHNALTRTIHW